MLAYESSGVAAKPHVTPALLMSPAAERDLRDVVLRHLKSHDEIATVLHLREEIDLSVHAAAGLQHFQTQEKKETSWASCLLSTSTASASARFASSRWGMTSL
jgi:hypothetical protein